MICFQAKSSNQILRRNSNLISKWVLKFVVKFQSEVLFNIEYKSTFYFNFNMKVWSSKSSPHGGKAITSKPKRLLISCQWRRETARSVEKLFQHWVDYKNIASTIIRYIMTVGSIWRKGERFTSTISFQDIL